MSALSEASTPAQDAAAPSLDAHQLQHAHLAGDLQAQGVLHNGPPVPDSGRKREPPAPSASVRPLSGHFVAKAPSVRRACTACHAGKTRCSEVLPCQVRPCCPTPINPHLSARQSCLKRGLGDGCQYPDPDAENSVAHNQPPPQVQFAPPPGMYPPPPPPPMQALGHAYYDYNAFAASTATAGSSAPASASASASNFRPAKRPRNLTEEEAAAITRNFTRGDFFVGTSAPVRIDPRLPVRLTLAEGDQVHFTIGETIV
ncbi:uncharacterized protein C8Q71DRAFT_848786 [Rhodofomes roseus]|uniref:Zn(2)-C6 fungal-type domain-containing protein n=1 Tax=Rhodofomes roseus TaxID=34475 RepID=A0ABQ8KE16_9APHY|nr:uncharacterized protein C8Q71DRAFT_848786 [Rhodofomes roseus]KAH9835853.1 hypothetical protein C8Q71DRAFT_848786 [Rhodofomes roseus]